MKRRIPLLLALLAAAASAGDNRPIDTKAAFARLKTLVGEWQGTGEKKSERLSYELIAGGTSLIERETADNRPAMITVYHMDGNRLLLTHFCMAGNQPRMEAREFDPATGRLHFDFMDATNLPGKDSGHMHAATLRIADHDHLASTWVYYEGGKPKFTEDSEFTRVR